MTYFRRIYRRLLKLIFNKTDEALVLAAVYSTFNAVKNGVDALTMQ